MLGLLILLAGHALDFDAVSRIGIVLASIPAIYFSLLVMAALVANLSEASTGDPAEVNARKERERETERETHIQTLSHWIEENRDASTLRAGYYYLWRASHRMEDIRLSFIQKAPLDKSLVNTIVADLQAVLVSSMSDAKLLKEARAAQQELDGLLTLVNKEKEPKVCRPQTRVEKFLGNRLVGVPVFALLIFLTIRGAIEKIMVEVIVFYLLALLVAAIHGRSKRKGMWLGPLLLFWWPPVGAIWGLYLVLSRPTAENITDAEPKSPGDADERRA